MFNRAAIVAALAVGLAGGVGGMIPIGGVAHGAAPSPTAGLRTIKSTPALVANGKAAYAMCIGCHGAEAEGRIGMAPRLASTSFLAAASDAMLTETIAKGRAGTTMVPWGGSLKPEQIDGIVAYLRSMAPSEPVELDERPVAGDVAVGAQVFRTICATCHGRSGAGYQESGSGTGIGRKVFLDTVTDGFLRYIIRHGKTDTQMRSFAKGSPVAVANLTDSEIDSVIAWMRKNAW